MSLHPLHILAVSKKPEKAHISATLAIGGGSAGNFKGLHSHNRCNRDFLRLQQILFMNAAWARNLFLGWGLLAALVFALPNGAWAQTEPAPPAQTEPPAQPMEQLSSPGEKAPFLYQREGRPDPFFPFLTQEIIKAEEKAREELPGMQRFEPGQLTLVAIIFAAREPLAMVQDSAGVGYVLKKGTKIGLSGEVIRIDRNRVIVQQAISDPGSTQKTRKVEMILKREGEI